MAVDSLLYSQSKALAHVGHIDKLRNGKVPAPVHVQLILSDLCNQDCSFCAYRMSSGLSTELFKTAQTHNPNRQIPTVKALEIIDDCATMGVKAIQFTGGGEPTVHKDHLQLFARAQENMQTALVTNGVKMKAAPEILDMEWIRVSVDAGTPETYSKVRGVSKSHWNKVWKNIDALFGYGGTLGIGFVITPDNYSEVARCAKLAREHGADNIRIGAVFSSEGKGFYGDTLPHVLQAIENAKVFETDDFKVIDLFSRRLDDLESGRPKHPFCAYQYFTTYIGGDLSVYRCCNTAYTPKGYLGSLKNTRFRDFLPIYTPFDAQTCAFCQFRGQNAVINAVLEPEHGNFV